MWALSRRSTFIVVLALQVLAAAAKAKAQRQHPEPEIWTYDVVAEYPHDAGAFTQGLQFDRDCDNASKICYDVFWESTGLNGRSSVRQVEVNTGTVRMKTDIGRQHFGEGVVRFGDFLYMLTWRKSTVFKFAKKDLKLVDTLESTLGDGWGFTHDGTHLIATESSEVVHFLEPGTLREVRKITVTDRGKPVRWMNEIEVVNDELWGNIWQTQCIARVNMTTGVVIGWVYMHGLRDSLIKRNVDGSSSMDVLNGIAWDAVSKRLFVTGKLWPRIFEVVPKPYELGAAKPSLADISRQCMPAGHI